MNDAEADGRPPVTQEMRMRIENLKTSIERDEYAVDPDAVAAAILAKLLRRQNECS
jgi:anti-sigma28 factor (negative regulator of flagellin synthesis)